MFASNLLVFLGPPNNFFYIFHTPPEKSSLTLQKRAVRILTFSEYNCHPSPLFRKLKIPKVSDLLYLYCALFMYDYYSNRLPSIFNDFLRVLTKCVNIKPDWRVRFLTICLKRGPIMANVTLVFLELKLGIPLKSH